MAEDTITYLRGQGFKFTEEVNRKKTKTYWLSLEDVKAPPAGRRLQRYETWGECPDPFDLPGDNYFKTNDKYHKSGISGMGSTRLDHQISIVLNKDTPLKNLKKLDGESLVDGADEYHFAIRVPFFHLFENIYLSTQRQRFKKFEYDGSLQEEIFLFEFNKNELKKRGGVSPSRNEMIKESLELMYDVAHYTMQQENELFCKKDKDIKESVESQIDCLVKWYDSGLRHTMNNDSRKTFKEAHSDFCENKVVQLKSFAWLVGEDTFKNILGRKGVRRPKDEELCKLIFRPDDQRGPQQNNFFINKDFQTRMIALWSITDVKDIELIGVSVKLHPVPKDVFAVLMTSATKLVCRKACKKTADSSATKKAGKK